MKQARKKFKQSYFKNIDLVSLVFVGNQLEAVQMIQNENLALQMLILYQEKSMSKYMCNRYDKNDTFCIVRKIV